MKWRGRRSSRNIEDRRSRSGGGLGRGGRGRGGLGGLGDLLKGGRGGARLPGGIKLGWLGMIVVVVVALFLGVDPSAFLGGGGSGSGGIGFETPSPQQAEAPTGRPPAEDAEAQFVGVVLADTEEVWTSIFAADGQRYREPILVLFSDRTETACGYGDAATGPFYCPADNKIYLDLSFFATLSRRLGAKGDFARA